MARGSIAKEAVVKKLQEAFGADFIGEVDRKIYIWSQENGERIQIALSLTCPKVPVEVDNTGLSAGGDWNFEETPTITTTATTFQPAEITEKERETVAALLHKLGL